MRLAYSCQSESVIFMTQSQPQKPNPFAALDKKVADGIAADKVAAEQIRAKPPAPQPAAKS